MRLLLAILLFAFSASAQMPPRVMGDLFEAFASSGSTPGITLDWSKGFESGVLESGLTETDASSKLDYAATAKYHGGSKSMSFTLDADNVYGFIKKDLSATCTNGTFCFWYYLPQGTDFTVLGQIAALANSASEGQYDAVLYYSKSGTAYSIKTRNQSGTFSTGIYVPATNAWYRIEVNYVKTGNTTLAVYNSSGTQVSTNSVITSSTSYTCNALYFGWLSAAGTVRSQTHYWDDLGYKINASIPIWPYTPAD